MKTLRLLLVTVSACAIVGPALADDTTSVRRDYSLNNGAGSTGPGMSGYLHQGMQDRPLKMTSLHNRKKGKYRVSDGFSNPAVYNNYVDLALQHIR